MIHPLEDFVALTLEKEEKTTASGIILMTDEKDKQSMGKVFSVGPKVSDLKPEDTVIYQSYSGTKVTVKGRDFLLIQINHILAKII